MHRVLAGVEQDDVHGGRLGQVIYLSPPPGHTCASGQYFRKINIISLIMFFFNVTVVFRPPPAERLIPVHPAGRQA